jgi:hypothetical protein
VSNDRLSLTVDSALKDRLALPMDKICASLCSGFDPTLYAKLRDLRHGEER